MYIHTYMRALSCLSVYRYIINVFMCRTQVYNRRYCCTVTTLQLLLLLLTTTILLLLCAITHLSKGKEILLKFLPFGGGLLALPSYKLEHPRCFRFADDNTRQRVKCRGELSHTRNTTQTHCTRTRTHTLFLSLSFSRVRAPGYNKTWKYKVTLEVTLSI